MKYLCARFATMPPPAADADGLQLALTARVVGQAFERALQDAGGSASAWQVLVLVRSQTAVG